MKTLNGLLLAARNEACSPSFPKEPVPASPPYLLRPGCARPQLLPRVI
jgi:hypothetical protein